MVIDVPVWNIFKKTGLSDRGMATDILIQNDLKKPGKKLGLWDRGVATGGPGQKPDWKKMTRSVRQSFGFWLDLKTAFPPLIFKI